jgi:histidinol-phosphate aminotransferase
VLRREPVIVLRSLSKPHGLAGLRVGYALGDRSLLDPIRRVREVVPFSVNGVAQAAALRALRAPGFLERTRREVTRSRTDLQAALGRLDVFHVPSVTNFVLLRSPVRDGALCPRLHREHDILVRDAASLGFPDHVRVSVGTRSQTARFIAALTEMMGAGDGG